MRAFPQVTTIKEVRAVTGLGLREAKDAVEGCPTVIFHYHYYPPGPDQYLVDILKLPSLLLLLFFHSTMLIIVVLSGNKEGCTHGTGGRDQEENGVNRSSGNMFQVTVRYE